MEETLGENASLIESQEQLLKNQEEQIGRKNSGYDYLDYTAGIGLGFIMLYVYGEHHVTPTYLLL